MRNAGYFALFCTLTLILSTGAFAKEKNEGSFDLSQPATVGATQLEPGHYKVEWTGTSGTVNVDIMKDGKTVATTTGELKELASSPSYTSVIIQSTPDHRTLLEEIDFNHRKDALVLSGTSAS